MRVRLSQSVLFLLSLLVLFFSLFFDADGRGVQVSPGLAPAKSLAVVSARQMAQRVLGMTADRALMLFESGNWIGDQAWSAARRMVRERTTQSKDDQGDLRRIRSASVYTTPQPSVLPDQVRVPILMYHHIAAAPPGADAVRRDLSVAPANFSQQMAYLQVHGYRTIGLADLVDHLSKGQPLPSRPVILTFDDGYDDNYTYAHPILRQHGYVGTFFILTDAVGQPGYMSWQQITEMSKQGMAIEAHGRTHDDLVISGSERATWQITQSRSILEERLGRPVRFYCYPSGRYSAQTISILEANGYAAAVSTVYGATHTRSRLFELRRVRIRGGDSLETFAIKLETAP